VIRAVAVGEDGTGPAGAAAVAPDARRCQPAGRLRRLTRDSMLRNSLFVFMTNAATAVLGFGFFVLAARLYTPREVGRATSLISGMGLVAYFALLGLNVTIVRYLPTSRRRDQDINTGLALVFLAAVAFATGYVLLLPVVAPSAARLGSTPVRAAIFVLLAACYSVNMFTDSVFVAFRSAAYNLIVDGFIQGFVKISLPAALVGLGAFGLVGSVGAGSAAAAVASVVILARRFEFRPRLQISVASLRGMFSFSSATYLGNLLNIAPPLLLPVLIVRELGSEAAGYFYLAFNVINVVFSLSYAICLSMFAEASHGSAPVAALARKAAVALCATIVPAAALVIVTRSLVLTAFGPGYQTNASAALTILALSAPAVAGFVLVTELLRILAPPKVLIVLNLVFAGAVLGLSTLWSDHGLPGMAMGWLVGHAAGFLLGLVLLVAFSPRGGTETPDPSPLPEPVRARRRGVFRILPKESSREDNARDKALSGRGGWRRVRGARA